MVLVILPAIWASITSQETRGKLVNTITGVLISAILAIIGVISLGSAGILQGVGVNAASGFWVFLAYIVLRFIANLFYFPYKIYREQERISSKYTWNEISVKVYCPQVSDLRGYGLKISSSKPHNIILEVPILESIHVNRALIPQIGHNKYELWWYSDSGGRQSSSVLLNNQFSHWIAIGDHRDNGAFLYIKSFNTSKIEIAPGKTYTLKIMLQGKIDGCILPVRYITLNVKHTGENLNLKIANDEIAQVRSNELPVAVQ